MRALRTAATGMAAQQLNVEVISNNIANMNTVGFKKQRAEFEDLLYQNLEQPGAQSSDQGTIVPTGMQIGAGVKAGSVYRITSQGTLTNTGNALDVAIQGPGFFQVLLPTATTAYTRAGNFSVNAQGQLVTADGYLVQPTIADPAERHQHHHLAAGQVQVTHGRQHRRRSRRRPAAAGAPSSTKPAWRPSATTSSWKPPPRARHRRHPRRAGYGTIHAGLHRNLQRRPGQRDHHPDHRPARLRDELQGGHHRRPDAVHRHQHEVVVMIRWLCRLVVLALALALAAARVRRPRR